MADETPTSKFKQIVDAALLPTIKAHSARLVQVAETLGNFHSKRAAMFERFATELQALVISTKRQLHREGQDARSDVTAEALWHNTLLVAGRDAEILAEMAEAANNIAEPLVKSVQLKKQIVQRIEADRDALEANLKKSEAELEKARLQVLERRKEFVAAQKSSGKARRKDSSVDLSAEQQQAQQQSQQQQQSALSYLRNLPTTLQAMRKDSAVEQEQTAQRRLHSAHNEYVLRLAGHNAELEKHEDENVPITLDRLEQTHVRLVDETKKSTIALTELLDNTLNTLQVNQKSLLQTVERVNGLGDAALFFASIQQPAQPFKQLEFRPPADADPSELWTKNELILEGCERALEKRSADYHEEVMTLASQIGRVQNTLFGVERLHNEYISNPAFGMADSILPQLYDCQNDIREARTRMLRYHVVLALLQAKCAERPTSGYSEADFDDDWAEEEATAAAAVAAEPNSGPTRQAVVLYDYAAANSDELTVYAGDVLTVSGPTEATWQPARSSSGVAGVVPANYIQFFEGDPSNQVRALYEFVASKEGELSFPVGAVVTVTERDQDGWTVGTYNGVRGAFPTSYVDFQFVRVGAGTEGEGRPRAATFAPADVAALVAANPHVPTVDNTAAELADAARPDGSGQPAVAAGTRSGGATPTPGEAAGTSATTAAVIRTLAEKEETDL